MKKKKKQRRSNWEFCFNSEHFLVTLSTVAGPEGLVAGCGVLGLRCLCSAENITGKLFFQHHYQSDHSLIFLFHYAEHFWMLFSWT